MSAPWAQCIRRRPTARGCNGRTAIFAARPRDQRDADWLGSGNLAVSRTAFELVGGFDTSLETCEDVDFCHRLRAKGQRVVERFASEERASRRSPDVVGSAVERAVARARQSARHVPPARGVGIGAERRRACVPRAVHGTGGDRCRCARHQRQARRVPRRRRGRRVPRGHGRPRRARGGASRRPFVQASLGVHGGVVSRHRPRAGARVTRAAPRRSNRDRRRRRHEADSRAGAAGAFGEPAAARRRPSCSGPRGPMPAVRNHGVLLCAIAATMCSA